MRNQEAIHEYLRSIQTLNSESAKSHRFSVLLDRLFGIQPGFIEDYVSGIERYVKVRQKDSILRGEVDNLFGNLVIEFERDLQKTREEAESQLKRYIACLWSQEDPQRRTSYIGVASDGINFVIYSPSVSDPKKQEVRPDDVNLCVTEEINLLNLEPEEIYFWLDRYFLRKEILPPTTENIVKDFGIKSHAFKSAQAVLLSLWKEVRQSSEFDIVYKSWEKYLRIVYGSNIAEEELFCRHTYLSILAKLMAWSRLSDGNFHPSQILSVLEGRFFKEQGIENFLEEDFFSWIVRDRVKERGVEIARRLLSLLHNYNLKELSEDVLKSLYQELVDPKTRHDLGEYYTPDWLAHRIVRDLIEEKSDGAFLDPACGSGTFLYYVIQEKRKRLPNTPETLEHILDSVVGVDIHPLAVIVAKTNYILALGELLKKRRHEVRIPVYLADSLRLPERDVTLLIQTPGYKVTLEEKEVYLPEKLLDDPGLYDTAIDAARDFALQNIGKEITEANFFNFVNEQHPGLAKDKDIVMALFYITQTLKDFMEAKKDTIWAFVLKNIYKPLFLKEKFDFIVGNPPWLAFRYAEPEYQKFLKKQIIDEYKLLSHRGELITHLELGTLFFVRAADLYLKKEGTIAFVLPRSVFTGDQHDGLRQGKFSKVQLSFTKIWDLEKVDPLFKIPSCVIFAQKKLGARISYPIPGEVLEGELQNRNSTLNTAEKSLHSSTVNFYLNKRGQRSFWGTRKNAEGQKASYYKKLFSQGATIVPRVFWFVEIKKTPLGFNPKVPPLVSAKHAIQNAKDPFKGLILEGNVESQFIYATILSIDLVPFGYLRFRPVVLPIEPSGNHYKLLNANEARSKGFIHLASWLERAENEWRKRKGTKADKMDIYMRLNRYRGLTKQNPRVAYKVLYNTSGTYLTACVVENKQITFDFGGQYVIAQNFVVDTKTYYFETNNRKEAQYLASVLNAPIVDLLIKPMQSRGKWGQRDIHKKVLELPIPQFDPTNELHIRLAELGEFCKAKVEQWIKTDGPRDVKRIGILRRKVREMLQRELKEIDDLVRQIITE